MSRIVVGMSGGVDSAVCAYLLKAAGNDVIGVTLRTQVDETRCCEINEAQQVADMLGIPYYVKGVMTEFRTCITEPFIQEYLKGRTPNPCTSCNRVIKWDGLIAMADALGADYVATGHYAYVEKLDNGRYTVRMADSSAKDQTYFLYQLTQQQLARTIMPLGSFDKARVRDIAREAGLPVFNKQDSQEICFIEEGESYVDYIEDHVDYEADAMMPGNFVDENGNILGEHQGLIHYTVGQRKGLGIALGKPCYVKELRVMTNEVVIAEDDALYSKSLMCSDLNFLSIPDLLVGESKRANVKIRHRHKGQDAVITRVSEDDVRVNFDEPVRAVTPGQAAVFYENGYVIGGGVIER